MSKTSNGFSRREQEIMDIITNLNQQGQTVVVVTHERDIAEYATRQVHLRDGIIEKDFTQEPAAVAR